MTRFKKELIKAGVQLEETLPYMPYEHKETIVVHADTCIVSTYDNRIGWYWEHYDRNLKVDRWNTEDDEQWIEVKEDETQTI